jgi:hypothetical protein
MKANSVLIAPSDHPEPMSAQYRWRRLPGAWQRSEGGEISLAAIFRAGRFSVIATGDQNVPGPGIG